MTATETLAGALTSTDDCDWIVEEAGYDPLRAVRNRNRLFGTAY
ncbi:hypothetical protein [Caballeronia sordidicola]|jgi:hypothetical protein|uniref:Uncharacterized protein n=1 Tax=Caballeronia sordidicola TaxID=196367 RepID=A0A226X7D7_CABSO|nr:hypothetical protein [Caballeronia sordidicola]OXC79372.1 hypothetical protein BSU04_06750 [Caballeronia sordidicola]